MPLAPETALPAALVGLAAGSFLNVVIHRIPIGETPSVPRRSYCPHCRAPIRARDNVPVVSYMILRASCRDCGARINPLYPAVELSTAAMCVGAVAWRGPTLAAAQAAVFLCLLLTLAVIDMRTLRLPNALTGAGAVLGLGFAVSAAAAERSWEALVGVLIAAAVGLAVLGVVRVAGSAAMRREAMGLGDVKLAGMIGAYLADWRLMLLTIALSAAIGSVVGVALRLAPAKRREIPYGPFLAAAAGVSLVWGREIIQAYARVVLGM
jgi:leader peptidase (prepilin peptidase) / N-methyltransferase